MKTSTTGAIGLAMLGLAACSNTATPVTDRSGPTQALAMPYAPTPDTDPFYAQPVPLPEVPPGTILNSREASFAPAGVPLPNAAWQLQYMSSDMHGRPQAAIATVVKPLLPALTGATPLLSYQFAVNSPGLKCAPSHAVTGSRENSNSMLESLIYLQGLQTQGWTLVFPDHLGPTSSVAVGRVAAPITLDGIRAAQSFEPLGLSGADTPVALMGYSGGALATAWSAALQPAYAPELNIVGVAAGGLPADIESLVKAFDGSAFFDIAFGAVISVNRLFPELLPPGFLNDKGVRTAEAVKDGCLGGTTDGSPAPTGEFKDYTTVEDIYATPGARSVMPKLSLPQPGEVPTAEIYFYHEQLDQLALIEGADKVVAAWCAEGTRIHYFRALSGEHFSGVASGEPAAFLYLVSRFAGSPTPLVPPGTESCNR